MDTNGQLFDCLCRTCMHELKVSSCDEHSSMLHNDDGDTKSQEWQSVYDIIEEERCSLRIAELLSQAVPQIEVPLSDELPKKICCKCLQQLLGVHRFQQMCLQTEQQLRQKVSKKRPDLKISIVEAAAVSEIDTIDAVSFLMTRFQPTQERLLEATEQVVELEPGTEFSIPATAMVGELESIHPGACTLEHSSIQKPLLESTEQVIKAEAAEINDIDQLLEDCRDSQGNLSEFVKNEPLEDEDVEIEYSDGETIRSIIPVKDALLAIKCEEQQINETSVKAQQKAAYEGLKRENCDICGKSIRKKCLKNHKLTHGGERAHKCDFCEKRFIQRSNLRSHMRTHTGDKPYKCKYCERSFSHGSHHIKHMRVHFGGYVYRCELCPLAFLLASELRIHLTTHENEDPETRVRNMKALQEAETKLQLDLSKKETQQTLIEESEPQFEIKAKKKVKVRRIINGEDKPYYECPYCPRRFHQISNMNRHKAIHGEVKREDCDICGKSIIKLDLKNHKRIHSDEKAYKCDFCEERFVHNCNLRAHIRKHTGEKPFKCKYCERSFSRAANLFEHMRVHFGRYIYRCELCPLAFPVRSELLEHFTTHKNEDSETREQNMKALQEAETELHLNLSKKDTEQSLREESLTQFETNAKPPVKAHECDICGKSFVYPYQLRRHILVHTVKTQHPQKEKSQKQVEMKANEHHISLEKYKPHECPYCPLRFRVLRSLSWHKKIHEGVHQVACDICGKIINKNNLKSHQLTHSNVKPHKCDICEKSFLRIHHLRRHMLKHTGEKPYKCKYCELAFTRPGNRNVHMRIHLGKNVHRCHFCPLAFPLAAELRLHFTSHKNEDPETRERNLKALKEEEAKLELQFAKNKSEQPQHQLEMEATE